MMADTVFLVAEDNLQDWGRNPDPKTLIPSVKRGNNCWADCCIISAHANSNLCLCKARKQLLDRLQRKCLRWCTNHENHFGP